MAEMASGNEGPKGLVFDVQGHSVHDGPGTRTTVFMAGCPLHCVWCCNPEGLFRKPILMHRETKCKHCGRCAASCPQGAITYDEKGCGVFDRKLCDACRTFDCVDACYNEALTVSGKLYSVDDLMKIFERDRQFWGSRGGATFSGGEPLLQKDFMLPLLAECKRRFIHVCVETTACLPPSYFKEAMKYIDWMFVDIKQMDPEAHRALTGVDNRTTLQNIKELGASDWPGFIVIRVPVIPGRNDSDENIRATAKFVRECGLEVINLLPFHRLGESKYRQVGREYEFADQVALTEEDLAGKKRLVEEEGLVCYVGHNTPF